MSPLEEYIVTTRTHTYRVQIRPDIAVRGGERGSGTGVSFWRIDAAGNALAHRGYQGPHTERRVMQFIKRWERAEVV